jgi:hypothetical protein
VYRLENPASAGDPIAVAERLVGDEIPIAALFDAGIPALAARMRAETRRSRRQ